MIVPQGDTYYLKFTTRSFSTGAPTQLAGTPVISVYEEGNLTQITAGITLSVDYDGVTGLNDVAIVATSGNGYEVGKYYSVVITTGTVGGVSVVGEVVGHFRCGPAEAAAGVPDVNVTNVAGTSQTAGDLAALITTVDTVVDGIQTDLSNGTDGLGAIKADTAAILTDTNELQTDWANAGRLDTILDTIAADVVNVDGYNFATQIGTAGAGLTNLGGSGNNWNTVTPLSAAQVNAEVDTALADIGLDHLIASALPTSWATDVASGSVFDQIADDGTAAYDRTTDSLQAISDSGGGGLTQQQVRDAMKLAPTGGAPAAGSVDEHLDDVLADTGTDIPATLSTIAGYIDTEVAAIKAVTDLLPDAGALTSLAQASALATAQADLDIITGTTGVVIEDGSITDASFDTTAGDFHALGVVDQGTAQAATSTTLQLRAGAAFADDELIGAVVLITGGTTGVGQTRAITDYVGATDTATVDAWKTTPTGTVTYKVFAVPPAPVTLPDVNVAKINGATVVGDGNATPWDGA